MVHPLAESWMDVLAANKGGRSLLVDPDPLERKAHEQSLRYTLENVESAA
jgi:hypothetical protein